MGSESGSDHLSGIHIYCFDCGSYFVTKIIHLISDGTLVWDDITCPGCHRIIATIKVKSPADMVINHTPANNVKSEALNE